jgi:mono/diheme cytochrome c family protein
MSHNLLFLSLLAALTCSAAGAQEPAKVVKVPARETKAMSGKALFREYCAACHGIAGKGDGPAASALKIPPADLTQIARRNGGKFPEAHVQHIIAGEAEVPAAHGSKEMPVWGNIFRHIGASRNVAAVRVYNLMKYLEQIQEK